MSVITNPLSMLGLKLNYVSKKGLLDVNHWLLLVRTETQALQQQGLSDTALVTGFFFLSKQSCTFETVLT